MTSGGGINEYEQCEILGSHSGVEEVSFFLDVSTCFLAALFLHPRGQAVFFMDCSNLRMEALRSSNMSVAVYKLTRRNF